MDEYELIGLFCAVADFVDEFNKMPQQELEYQKKRICNRQFRITLSERMTILIMFHKSNYRMFKHFFMREICEKWKHYFRKMVSYS